MVKRSEEEIKRILSHCVELERAGESVLAYLQSEGYISPRATWYNLQREWLGRDREHMTEGRAGEPARSGSYAKRRPPEELMRICIAGINAGKSPLEVLKEYGYKRPDQHWPKIKLIVRKNYPDLWAKIPAGWRKPGLSGPSENDEPDPAPVEMPAAEAQGPVKTSEPEKINVVCPFCGGWVGTVRKMTLCVFRCDECGTRWSCEGGE